MSDRPLLDMLEHDAGRRHRREVHADSKSGFPSQESRVCDYVSSMPQGATRDEIAEALSLPVASVCGRVASLLKQGRIAETSLRRPTRNGKTAVVLIGKDLECQYTKQA